MKIESFPQDGQIGVSPGDRIAAHVVVYGNPQKEGLVKILQSILRWGARGGHALSIESEIAARLAEARIGHDGQEIKIYSSQDPSERIFGQDRPALLVCLGGDGTLLHAVHRFWPLHVPVIGVSLGTLSFNAAVHPDDVAEALDEWLAGRMRISERLVIRALHYRGAHLLDETIALNDVVLCKKSGPRLIHVELRQGDEMVSSFAGDGLIVSTPTGSTAYNLSAGGPIIHPSLVAMVATAICPHTLTARPVVVPPNPPLELAFIPQHGVKEAMLTIDGQREWTITAEDRIVLEASETRIQLASNSGLHFFQRLREKLCWSRELSHNGDL